jgi:hypothetical protein
VERELARGALRRAHPALRLRGCETPASEGSVSEIRIELPRHEHPFVGTWHICSMEMWDEDYFNEETQAFIQVRPENLGSFQFGLVSGGLDGYLEGSGRNQRFVFTWEGSDEMDPVTGGGWLQLKGENELLGCIKFHMGDRSGFRARRAG